MRTPIKVKTLKDAERYINRLARRSKKTATALSPAVPIYSFCAAVPEDGIILRYLSAVPGRFIRIIIRVPEATPSKRFNIRAELLGSEAGTFVEAEIRKEQAEVAVDFAVQLGDRLVVQTSSLDFSNIEVAAAFVPDVDTGTIHKVLIDTLEGEDNEGE